ncbi:FxSxx-COOH system tetratricopeptide repeat protein [Nonomuraea typhae]|uniref:FxSxx-COOH system tetratricopeptide repeat protein n=1 Tax=Nonomuraea typhae TaxID=2603600 RepID=A0ABW7YVI4_9ACTN
MVRGRGEKPLVHDDATRIGPRRLLVVTGGLVLAILAAIGAYAGLAAQNSGLHVAWTAVASTIAGVFAFLTTTAGGYAVLNRQLTPAGGTRSTEIRGGVPPRNNSFTGRTEPMDSIHTSLRAEPARGRVRSCALCGLGGVGKTALAAEYVYRFRSEYPVVWWVRAEHPSVAIEDLSRLFVALTGNTSLDSADVVNQLWPELAAAGPWLLIFDNARSPESLRDLWPTGADGCVIVTSRTNTWSELVDETITVEVFSHQDAIALLRARTRSDDRESAAEVADHLGRLPLALVQAAAYVNESKTTLRHYSDLVQRQMGDIMATRPPSDYNVPVATTWSMSIAEADARAPGARDLLTFCSYLAPERIQRTLPLACVDDLPAELAAVVRNPVRYDLAVAALLHYSLATAEADHIALHRLVQFTVRFSLREEDQLNWAETAIRAMDRRFPRQPADKDTWERCAALTPHVLAAVAHVSRLGSTEPKGDLLMRAGVYHMARDLASSALDLFRMALVDYEHTCGPDSLEVAEICGELARVQHRRADLADALVFSERAIRIKEHRYGATTTRLIPNVAQLGGTLMESARYAEARDSMERALVLAEAAYGPTDQRLLEHLRHLFWLHMKCGRFRSGLRLVERGVDIQARAANPEERAAAFLHEELGHVHQEMGDYESALSHAQRSRDLSATLDGPDSYRALTCETGIATALISLGDHRSAFDIAAHCLEGLSRLQGEDHPDCADALEILGLALHAGGRFSAAMLRFSQAIAIYEHFYGCDHPYVARPLRSLATAQLALGDIGPARAGLDKAEQIILRHSGSRHPEYARILQARSEAYRVSGDTENAAALIREADEILRDARRA